MIFFGNPPDLRKSPPLNRKSPPKKNLSPAAPITAKFSPATLWNTLLYYFNWWRTWKFAKIGTTGENLRNLRKSPPWGHQKWFFLESLPPSRRGDAPPPLYKQLYMHSQGWQAVWRALQNSIILRYIELSSIIFIFILDYKYIIVNRICTKRVEIE